MSSTGKFIAESDWFAICFNMSTVRACRGKMSFQTPLGSNVKTDGIAVETTHGATGGKAAFLLTREGAKALVQVLNAAISEPHE